MAELKHTVIVAAKYRCKRCDEIHDCVDEALECCAPGVAEVFLCPVCGEAHEGAIEALSCCDCELSGETEDVLESQLVSKAGLEQAGQVRLFP